MVLGRASPSGVARVEEDGIKIVSARTTEDPEFLAVQIDRKMNDPTFDR